MAKRNEMQRRFKAAIREQKFFRFLIDICLACVFGTIYFWAGDLLDLGIRPSWTGALLVSVGVTIGLVLFLAIRDQISNRIRHLKWMEFRYGEHSVEMDLDRDAFPKASVFRVAEDEEDNPTLDLQNADALDALIIAVVLYLACLAFYAFSIMVGFLLSWIF